jgi:hypothetical protein
MELNPANAFLQGAQGIPIPAVLSGFDQRSFYFRLTKHLSWGKPLPAGGLDRYADVQTRLQGTVEGTVLSLGIAGKKGAAGVTATLDEERTAVTDASGQFRFSKVPEGNHRVLLAMGELPAEYDPGPAFETTLEVRPGRSSSAALEVWRLGSIAGTIVSANPSCGSSLRLRLEPSGRYTRSDAGGAFSFYNLRESEYEVSLDTRSLKEGCVLVSGDKDRRVVATDASMAPVRFEIQFVENAKPVRRVDVETAK